MTRKEKERKEYRQYKKGYYHLSTDGWKKGLLFNTTSQYAYGMILIGLLTLRFDIRIYSFALMRNHVHILLSGTGEQSVNAFEYLKRKINTRLRKDGYPALPEDYWFKMVPIEDKEQMKRDFIYIDRNAYEVELSVPCGYVWSSGYLHFSQIGKYISAPRADSLSKRKLERLTGSRTPIPGHWKVHPELGLLPESFVDNTLFYRLFKSVKDYETHLVKDYESHVRIAHTLGEKVVFSQDEAHDIAEQIVQGIFPGRTLSNLSRDEKAQVSVTMSQYYDIPIDLISITLKISEHLVNQFLRSKDYGKKAADITVHHSSAYPMQVSPNTQL